jgi:hypothetical protein
MKENLKLGLLGLVAVLTIFNTYQLMSTHSHGESETSEVNSNQFANPNALNDPHAGHDHDPNNPFGDQSIKVDPNNDQPAAPAGPPTTITFEKMDHDFGEVMQDSENKYKFKFTNTGSNPLIISSAQGSCGCTVPSYPKEPIAPGKTGEIEVVYSPGKQENAQSKTVTLVANTEPSTTVLNIKAFVKKPQ